MKKHNPNVKVVAADPIGSILAVPESLNSEVLSYKVEGIGYDFIPDVLNRPLVDEWIKTNDKESFVLARRLIREEGILCGGSSGSAMAALVAISKDLTEDDTVVVVLPDSVRNYLTKFVDDTWMENNNFVDKEVVGETQQWEGAKIRDLSLKPVVCIREDSPVSSAIETMRDKGYDQLPVNSAKGRLVGLVTLGNLLSYISRGRASSDSPVSSVMFDFRKITEVVTDPREIGTVKPLTDNAKPAAVQEGPSGNQVKKGGKRNFDLITLDTPLSALSRFCKNPTPHLPCIQLLMIASVEHNSAGIVTEKSPDGEGYKPIHVVTKVDLLSFLVKQEKH